MKKWIFLVVVTVGIVGLIGYAWLTSQQVPEADQESIGVAVETARVEARVQSGGQTADTYKQFRDNVLSGGVPQDGIPPIDNPKWSSVDAADQWLKDSDYVFVMETESKAYAYPQRIMVWHEIVNQEVDGETRSITYCPLTGSCIGFKDVGEDGMGTSGRLLNSNLVMYDRASERYWPQILGESIDPSNSGEALTTYPMHWVEWGRFKKAFPTADVLTQETGYFRDYNRDPYGSYDDADSYYYSTGTFFPVMNEDDRLPDKQVVVGIKGDQGTLALTPEYVKARGHVNDMAGQTPVVAFYDEVLDVIRVYVRESVDPVQDPENLKPANYFSVMWFAWQAFYPETELRSE